MSNKLNEEIPSGRRQTCLDEQENAAALAAIKQANAVAMAAAASAAAKNNPLRKS